MKNSSWTSTLLLSLVTALCMAAPGFAGAIVNTAIQVNGTGVPTVFDPIYGVDGSDASNAIGLLISGSTAAGSGSVEAHARAAPGSLGVSVYASASARSQIPNDEDQPQGSASATAFGSFDDILTLSANGLGGTQGTISFVINIDGCFAASAAGSSTFSHIRWG